MVDKQQTDRLKALWKSGRDKFRSFFTVINEVRRDIGDEELGAYCLHELGIGLSVILDVAKIFNQADEKILKEDLAAAARAEKEKREAENAEKAFQRQKKKAERDAELAEKRTLAAKAQAEAVENQSFVEKVKRAARKQYDRSHSEIEKAQHRRRDITKGANEHAPTSKLIKAYLKSDAMCEKGEEFWVEGSIGKAVALLALRIKYPNDKEFSKQLEENGLGQDLLDKDTRAALIGLGWLGTEHFREILRTSDTRSYRAMWLKHKPDKVSMSLIGS
jgi:hypothetical protein